MSIPTSIAPPRGLRTPFPVLVTEPKRSRASAHRGLPTPQHALNAIFGIREVPSWGLAALPTRGEQLAVHPLEGRCRAVVGAQPEDQPPAMLDLVDWGLKMAPGTLGGGLKALAPLFEPMNQALVAKRRSATHWHADETRWAVFVHIEGKVGHRWQLWVFHVGWLMDGWPSLQARCCAAWPCTGAA